MQKIPKELVLSLLLVLVCVSRLIPHPYNFSPVGSIFIMAPFLFSDRKWSLTISFLPLLVSDIMINKIVYNSENLLYEGFLWIYLSYLFIWLYSYKVEQRQNLFFKSIAGSLIFFFVTNTICWYGNISYPQDIYGLFQSWAAGVPFYWNSLAGFIFYTGIIYYLQKIIKYRFYKKLI